MQIDRYRCTKCDREKPIGEFQPLPGRKCGHHSWCRACVRVQNTLRGQTAYTKQYRRDYCQRPDVKIKERARKQESAWHHEYNRRWRASPWGKALTYAGRLRRDLARAEDKARRARLRARLAVAMAEVARMRAARERLGRTA